MYWCKVVHVFMGKVKFNPKSVDNCIVSMLGNLLSTLSIVYI